MSSRLRTSLGIMSFGFGIFVTEALYSGNEKFYREQVMPWAHKLIPDCEKSHKLALTMARHGLFPRKPNDQFPELKRTVFGLQFNHPVGLAAGFDKNGEAVLNLLNSGFSHVEVGTVTPLPQPGNPCPRMFRWPEKEAVINRCGFNSDGHDAVYERLKNRPWAGRGIVGVNLGCNKTSADPVGDYVLGVEKFGEIADYLVINVSSPNTPGLRSLQLKSNLTDLLTRVLAARSKLTKKTPILLKMSPDEDDQTIADLVSVVMNPKTRVDGLIISNTTLASEDQALACGAAPLPAPTPNPVWGGLSGRPLMDKSTACLVKVAKLTQGQLPLIGVGGISTGQDAQTKLEAGASLVQLYTSLIYQGPPVAHRIAREIQKLSNPTTSIQYDSIPN